MTDLDDRALETILAIIDLLDAGKSSRAIRAATGCSEVMLAKLIRHRQVEARRQRRLKRRLPGHARQ
jgi:hypothetical protein